MKELVGFSTNLLLLPLANGQVQASAEVILQVSEPEYLIDGDKMGKVRKLESLRFAVTTEAAYKLVQSLQGLASDMEEMEADFNKHLPKKEEAPPPPK